ncbi:hypothetical protein K1719_000227 [Acacia pycnantha]|nr:hypothetical protein K1719_000227 [Acacia pycnantha]
MKRKADTQSTQAAPSSGHYPSFFGASLQSYIQDALKQAVDTVLRSNASILASNESILKENEVFLNRMEGATDKLVTTVEDTLKTLLSRIYHNFQLIFQQQDEHEKRINKLEKNMDDWDSHLMRLMYLHILHPHISLSLLQFLYQLRR